MWKRHWGSVRIFLIAMSALVAVLYSGAYFGTYDSSESLIENPGFEADWGSEQSHTVLILPVGDDPYYTEIGNIFTPPKWTTWFRHDPGNLDQPEVRDAWKSIDPTRVHSGNKAIQLFTFYRRHEAGFFQQIEVEPGVTITLTAFAHAWSNTPLPGYEWCKDRGGCSCGVGFEETFILEGDAPPLNGDPWNDAIGNMTFYVGIDPTGGVDPTAGSVVWGRGAHIYNAHRAVPSVIVETGSDVITVFLRSKTLWAFKHNDVYWDDVILMQKDPVYLQYLPLVLLEGQNE